MIQRPPRPDGMVPAAAAVPTLETERLILRAHTRADWEDYRPILMSDRAQYMDGKLDETGAWACFASELASWVLDDIGYWTAARKTDNKAVAFVGIMHPSAYPETELGWMTTEESEGKGFAYEAASAVLDWAFGPRGIPTLVSYIDRDNARSIALAERLGAARDDAAAKSHPADVVFRHPRRAHD
ncbi:MAG: GNAT family N-acetyltransferase [Pseudomonadota bacterium]